MRVSRLRSTGNLRIRYDAYARDHGMTSAQMRDLDRSCYPDTMLTPFFHWLSVEKLEWIRVNPGRTLQNLKDHVDFERWLGEQEPKSNPLTCDCHGRYTSQR